MNKKNIINKINERTNEPLQTKIRLENLEMDRLEALLVACIQLLSSDERPLKGHFGFAIAMNSEAN